VAVEAVRREITLHRDFADPDRLAICDPDQMYQVVLNLVVNALQALPAKGSIRLCTFVRGNGVVGFQVEDDGPGLPPSLRERIFQPFVTGREDGTGLGLAFVERIVKAHHGSIELHSEPNEGTIFRVTLPEAT
jgi:signal transduction histidine kinase